jgi:multidrug efflux pump subunit AcrB
MNLLFIVLILAGALVVTVIPVDVYPDVDLDEALIETFWAGASAEDVERLITDRIEGKIGDIRGVQRIRSDSKPDASFVFVKFSEALTPTQLDSAFRQLRAAVERVTDLPEDAEKPLIRRISLAEVFPLLWVVVEDTGNVGEDTLHEVVLKLKPVLSDIPGVSKVDDKLIRDRELHILVDGTRLGELDYTLDEVAATLAQYNRNVPSGTLKHDRGEFNVRAVGEAITPEQFGAIAVRKHHGGSHVYVRDIATIERSFERKTFFARFNAWECKALSIAKTDEADSRRVAQQVRDTLAKFRETLPPGVGVSACLDTSEIISSRMRILLSNLGTGIALVFATLWLVMGFRNSMLAVVGIPFSFLCALIFMHLLGVTINAVSLFAMVLCSGMIVDDAIVVLENIYRHIETGRAREQATGEPFRLRSAIIEGTNEVMWPVISSSMTTVVAFLPLLMMAGVTGKFFSIIPKTVAVVLTASLVECLLILPVHYLDYGPRRIVRPLWTRITGAWKHGLTKDGLLTSGWMKIYDRFIGSVLRYRYFVPLPLMGLGFLAFSYAPLIPVDLFPSDYQLFLVDVVTWHDASLDQTGKTAQPIEQLILGLGPEYVESVLTSVGLFANQDNTPTWRNNHAQLHVKLADTPATSRDPDVVSNMVREKIGEYLANNPDSGLKAFKVWAPQDGPPIGTPVSIRIETPNLSVAKRLAERYKQRLSKMPGVLGISDNLDFGPKQINLRLREDEASAHGLTQPSLAIALRTANEGLVVSAFKDTRTGEDLDVRVVLDERYRRNLDDLLDVEIRTPGGYLVRLRDICEIDMSQGYASIPHFNEKRVITVSAQIDTSLNTAKRVNGIVEDEFKPVLARLDNVRVTYAGEYEETTRSFNSLKRAYVIAMIVIYVLLATQFRSYAQPFVIIATVPFSCVGVVAGLALDDYPFTIMTFIAMVGLTGVVVNDSIVLIDFVNKQLASGKSVMDAVRSACVLRIRPIILTTVTTVLGLLPLAMGWGGRSKIWSPFASSFAWGLVFSTILTLVVIPACYVIAHDIVSRVRSDRLVDPELGSEPASATPPTR